jgi:CxxC motif-containing protein (DUF1111 family)
VTRRELRFALVLLAAAALGCGDGGGGGSAAPPPGRDVDPREVDAGGATTVVRADEKAFSQSAPNLDFAGEANFKSGNLLFRRTPRGLGPLFATQSCQGCHERDGRGNPPARSDEPMIGLLLRLSVPTPAGGLGPDPVYGDQIQGFGVDATGPSQGLARHDGALLGDGAIGEAFASIAVEEIAGRHADGEPYVLHRPVYRIRDLSYGPFPDGIVLSPRVAQPMIGLGLLEAIPAEDVLAREDPDDADGDGISGRANFVFDRSRGETRLGRFGWKASQPSVLQQTAGAYAGDIGITSSVVPDENCGTAQTVCRDRAASEPDTAPGGVDLSDLELALVEFYGRHLAVPQRRGWDPEAKTWAPEIGRGRELFFDAGCASCHVPMHETGMAEGSVLGDVDLTSLVQPAMPLPALSSQVIWPYTDLLLHDMGGRCDPVRRETATGESCGEGADCLWVQRCEGLADGRPDELASGSEWRTPPLWGLGLTRVVNPDAGYLHDGRARTVEEAILWHGGEADAARRFYSALSSEDRRAMLAFLDSQ